MATNPLDKIQLDEADDLGPKCACILLLDVSYSMGVSNAIQALNAGLLDFQHALETKDIVQYRVDLAVLTFIKKVQTVCDFIPAAEFQAAPLTADGRTPMGEAICTALEMLENRKEYYRLRGNPVYRPWIIMITDGEPTDPWQDAAARVREAEQRKACVFYAVGVEGAKFEILEKISVRKPMKLRGLAFGELFVWLSNSLGGVASTRPGDKVAVEKPSSDFIID